MSHINATHVRRSLRCFAKPLSDFLHLSNSYCILLYFEGFIITRLLHCHSRYRVTVDLHDVCAVCDLSLMLDTGTMTGVHGVLVYTHIGQFWCEKHFFVVIFTKLLT